MGLAKAKDVLAALRRVLPAGSGFIALHEPHSSLVAKHQDLIWKLLVNIAPLDPLHLYWYDKEDFYKSYKTWDESYKEWVIEYVSNII